MAWKLTSTTEPDRWVAYHNGDLTSDPLTRPLMAEHAGTPVPLAPNSEIITPDSPDDELGLYLLARVVLPGPVDVTGTPPPVPEPSEHRDDVAY